ncbi:MAG: ribosome silencing factor [Clostridiales bacterium]|nr:ribosome silencing factor [Clostridiales bacterium]
MTQKEVIAKIIKTLDAKKAEDIQAIGIKDLTIIADYFIIANGTSTTHTKTLADEVEHQLTEVGVKPTRVEGYNGASWIVLDYADIIVHIFYKETRDFYKLERLWSDGEYVNVNEFLGEE